MAPSARGGTCSRNCSSLRAARAIHGWWHGFFSFVDSGPPSHRLREMLALHRAGFLKFLVPGMWVRTDESTGRFMASSFQSPVVVDASAYIEARLPPASVERSANPALADLQDAGWGTEQRLLTSADPHSTGKLLVSGIKGSCPLLVLHRALCLRWDRGRPVGARELLPAPTESQLSAF